jgi:hypothetical protein
MAPTTRPKPQFSSEATAATRKVSVTAWLGVRALATRARRNRATTGAWASACPVARIRIIWKAKARIANVPEYQELMMVSGAPFGAISRAKMPVTAVSPIEMTKGSGI